MKKLLSISLALILGFTAIHTYNISANESAKKVHVMHHAVQKW
jgi:uncharacterized membrane protein